MNRTNKILWFLAEHDGALKANGKCCFWDCAIGNLMHLNCSINVFSFLLPSMITVKKRVGSAAEENFYLNSMTWFIRHKVFMFHEVPSKLGMP